MKFACFKVVLLFTCCFFSAGLWAQTRIVSGLVTSNEDQQPLAGVSIQVKGKGAGSQTGTNGRYSIEAGNNDVLVFSYTGYSSQEVPVGMEGTINVSLAPGAPAKMDEVVVIGYGTQTRRQLTGAVATVNPKTFEHNPTTNVATVLQGNAPGLRVQQSTGQPGTSPAISFRGGTEFGGGGTPLFIIDGVIVPSLYGLDINDVASIDVLKDAATTAIYGARAANGVVLVTTKKGKRGKTQVTYSFSHTSNFIRPNASEYLGAADYIRMNRLGIQARFRADSLDNNTNAMNTDRNQLQGAWGWAVNNGWRSPIGLYSTQILNSQNRQLLNDPNWKLLVDPNPFNVSQVDSLLFTELTAKEREAMILQRSNTIEHNVGFSGANEQGSYALSVGSVRDHGIIIGSWLKRLNMNFNGGLNVGKNLKVTSNISAYTVEQGLPYSDPAGGAAGGLMQRFVGVAPTVRYRNDTSGAPLPGPNDITLGNPFYWSNIFSNNTNQQRFLGALNLEYSLFPFLKLLAGGSGYLQYTNNNFFTKAFQQGNGGALNTNRTASFNNSKSEQYTTNAFLQFNKNFSGHSVTVLAGGEFYDIDVGLSRSTDSGRTWHPMKIIMDMGAPHENNGIGDPAILFDPVTKKIWVAALWSKGNRSIAGSKPGLSPDTTGQFVLVSSDDDGLTWSDPINITRQVKNPAWHLFFNGPGSGIAMQNGRLVFAAQYWDEKKMPHSTIIHSDDHGKTWKGKIAGPRANTTEAQVVETAPGTLMLNMRDNRGSYRSVATTNDLGATWTEHQTSYNALPDPVCMGSIIKARVKVKGAMKDVLFFSNPATKSGRYNMTIKASLDGGETWLPANEVLVDERFGFGYSSLTKIDNNTIGFLYEGSRDLYFVQVPVADIIK